MGRRPSFIESCHRNLEVLWLLCKLKPDFKTIADFRRNNAALQGRCARVYPPVPSVGFVWGQLLAIDGTKFKASNAADQNWSQTKLHKQLAELVIGSVMK